MKEILVKCVGFHSSTQPTDPIIADRTNFSIPSPAIAILFEILTVTSTCRGGASCPPSRDYASHLELLYILDISEERKDKINPIANNNGVNQLPNLTYNVCVLRR
jgi:hypothetical protein